MSGTSGTRRTAAGTVGGIGRRVGRLERQPRPAGGPGLLYWQNVLPLVPFPATLDPVLMVSANGTAYPVWRSDAVRHPTYPSDMIHSYPIWKRGHGTMVVRGNVTPSGNYEVRSINLPLDASSSTTVASASGFGQGANVVPVELPSGAWIAGAGIIDPTSLGDWNPSYPTYNRHKEQMWIYNFTAGTHILVEERDCVQSESGFLTGAQFYAPGFWSHDGTKFVYNRYREKTTPFGELPLPITSTSPGLDLWVVNSDGTGKAIMFSGITPAGGGYASTGIGACQWSPVANNFFCHRVAPDGTSWIASSSGGILKSWAADGGTFHDLSVSEDGTKVAYLRNGKLYLMDSNGSNHELLSLTTFVQAGTSRPTLDWFRDDSRILVLDANNDFRTVNPDNGQTSEVKNFLEGTFQYMISFMRYKPGRSW